MYKICFVCKEEKDLEEFYNHPKMADGHLNKCKECAKKQGREYHFKGGEERLRKMREYFRARFTGLSQKERAKQPRYRRDHPKEYASVHGWVSRNLSKTDTCVRCKKSGLGRYQIEWSNNSGEYKREVSDWERLCISCHRQKDNDKYKKN